MNEKHEHKWRCRGCGRLLGVVANGRLEIRFARGHQYHTALPATCVCRNPDCNTLNELPGVPAGRSAK
jgi:hypothetical protein